MILSWRISKEGFDPSSIELDGSRFLIANGYMGYRGTLEEFGKDELVACTVAGVYDRYDDKWRELVNVPNGLFVKVYYNDTLLSPMTFQDCAHTYGLDLKDAYYFRDTKFFVDKEKWIRIQTKRFASSIDYHLLCLEYSITANFDCEIEIQTGIDCDIWEINGPHFKDMRFENQDRVYTISLVTNENKNIVVAEISDHLDDFSDDVGPKLYIRKSKVKLARDKEFKFYKYMCVTHSIEFEKPFDEAIKRIIEAKNSGFDSLFEKHRSKWQERWIICNIDIDGDEKATLALRFSMYHLLSIAPYHSEKLSIPARGLSGQMYKGAVFWDTEIFMLPFFSYTFPDVARNLVMYRVHTLDGARRKAKEYGFEGAFYAWESQETGDDACSLFNVTDVITQRPIRTYFRDKQIHISGDVVYGFFTYYNATDDFSIFLEGAAEAVFECAKFYYSYAYYKPLKDRFEILDVTGPDEYHERVNNNAYTNRIAKFVFEKAIWLYDILKEKYPNILQEIDSKTGISQYIEKIKEAEQKIFLQKPDEEGIIEQFDGYLKLEDIKVEKLKEKMLHPYEYLGGGNGLATQTQVIKQADVVVLLNLFESEYEKEILKANLEYYNRRTEHGSTLSYSMYGLLAAKIGKLKDAYEYFLKTALIDLEGNYKQYVGNLYIGGTHPAANGGAWMATVFGFGGIRVEGTKVEIDPHLPSHWKSLRFNLIIHGNLFEFEISNSKILVKSTRLKDSKNRSYRIVANKREFIHEISQLLEINLKGE